MKRAREDIGGDEQNTGESRVACLEPSCRGAVFSSYEEYEHHVIVHHWNECTECHRVLPSEHFLQLHIDENHNPLLKIQQEQGVKIFRCFQVDCPKMCSTPKKRRLHMVDKHGYPKEYDWRVVNRGVHRKNQS